MGCSVPICREVMVMAFFLRRGKLFQLGGLPVARTLQVAPRAVTDVASAVALAADGPFDAGERARAWLEFDGDRLARLIARPAGRGHLLVDAAGGEADARTRPAQIWT
jgi:hypothetical protein